MEIDLSRTYPKTHGACYQAVRDILGDMGVTPTILDDLGLEQAVIGFAAGMFDDRRSMVPLPGRVGVFLTDSGAFHAGVCVRRGWVAHACNGKVVIERIGRVIWPLMGWYDVRAC